MPVPCVLAVGKFESIHIGHRALISEMKRLAHDSQQPGLACALVVFVPHPYTVLFDPEYRPLFTGSEREHLVQGLGVDYLLEYPFDRDFAMLSPEDFSHMLFKELQTQVVVVGAGYRFGHKRVGTVDTLRQIAGLYGAEVHVVAPRALKDDAPKISTSIIRELLSANMLPEAEDLLGYPFFISGEVTPGRQLGRTIGFPTINMYPPAEKFLLSDGVYVTSTIIGTCRYKSITNIGLRPTIESSEVSRSVETHLLDYEGSDLYGKQVRVEFLRFIRPEKRFDSLGELKTQILEDCRSAML